MRLIDADAMRNDWLENGENEYVYDTNVMLDSIDAQPTIDAVPVDKMVLYDLSIKTENRMAKAVFLFGDKKITLCRDCGELAPVVHGRWETNNDPEEIVKDFSCSVCEELLCDFDTYALTPGENCFYYCPHCGARMDGGV